MKHRSVLAARFFFATAPLPCPYIEGHVERRVVTELAGRETSVLNDSLSRAGFRRSHAIAYAPACPDCEACTAVRVPVGEFVPSRIQKRVWKRNSDLAAGETAPDATPEQFDLFHFYQESRHGDGDMAKMDYLDYQALIEESPIETMVVEFRDSERRLVAACLADRLGDGLSAVYSFYDPGMGRRSLGVYMILWLIERARAMGLAHVYLGFWIEDVPKMAYKSDFRPLEGYRPGGWRRLGGERNA